LTETQLFRIGPGYVEYWMHEVTHWNVETRHHTVAIELGEAFMRLIAKRDAVENARRAFIPVSSLPTDELPSDTVQKALFDATHDFFQTYYSTLSAFASFLTRFRNELGDVPHGSNTKLLAWLEKRSLLTSESMPVLGSARQFRALIDHRAQHQPFTWGTEARRGGARIFLHGPGSSSGGIPEGAMQTVPEEAELPDDHIWVFPAPDEDRVLSALAVQMNALFPRIQVHRMDKRKVRECNWAPRYGVGDPRDGYPILSAFPGRVVDAGPMSISGLLDDMFKDGPISPNDSY
tara:strand:+ start:987 stop:1859 length:873 start_codon:yes stop_codon:yes gene_type:complete